MRICSRCQSKMREDCNIRIQGAGYGITIITDNKLFADRLTPKVAVCPQCGEVSLYIEHPEKLK